MTKEMIISSNGHETMVAILEDNLAAEIFVERERQRGVVGNVYKGRVSKVLPGMQSSFIDLGLERDGFLYVADVVDTLEEFDKLESGDEEGGGAERGRRDERPRAAEDRGPPQGGPGDSRPGRQGAARHQGRAPHVARHHGGALSGLHADGRSRRRLQENRVARGAQPAARHRARVPRGARLHGRRHHPHGRRQPAQGRHRQRPRGLPQDLARDPPAHGVVARAGGRLSRAEPGGQAAARSADRRVPGHPHRPSAGASARPRAHRTHHAGARRPK